MRTYLSPGTGWHLAFQLTHGSRGLPNEALQQTRSALTTIAAALAAERRCCADVDLVGTAERLDGVGPPRHSQQRVRPRPPFWRPLSPLHFGGPSLPGTRSSHPGAVHSGGRSHGAASGLSTSSLRLGGTVVSSGHRRPPRTSSGPWGRQCRFRVAFAVGPVYPRRTRQPGSR